MHRTVLTEAGARLFPSLPQFNAFYLAGGTALALQLGHRISVDFDLFTPSELPDTLLAKVKRIFKPASLVVAVRSREELTLFVDGVKVTFLHYPFPLIRPLADLAGLPTASVLEIAAMKAYTLGRREAYKDYADLFAALASGSVHLPEILEAAQQKFGDEFNDRLFLEQLTAVVTAEVEPITFVGASVEPLDMVRLFEAEIRQLPLIPPA